VPERSSLLLLRLNPLFGPDPQVSPGALTDKDERNEPLPPLSLDPTSSTPTPLFTTPPTHSTSLSLHPPPPYPHSIRPSNPFFPASSLTCPIPICLRHSLPSYHSFPLYPLPHPFSSLHLLHSPAPADFLYRSLSLPLSPPTPTHPLLSPPLSPPCYVLVIYPSLSPALSPLPVTFPPSPPPPFHRPSPGTTSTLLHFSLILL